MPGLLGAFGDMNEERRLGLVDLVYSGIGEILMEDDPRSVLSVQHTRDQEQTQHDSGQETRSSHGQHLHHHVHTTPALTASVRIWACAIVTRVSPSNGFSVFSPLSVLLAGACPLALSGLGEPLTQGSPLNPSHLRWGCCMNSCGAPEAGGGQVQALLGAAPGTTPRLWAILPSPGPPLHQH